MAELALTDAPAAPQPFVPPYAPSWVDRLIVAIHRAPMPAWVIYGGLVTLLVGLEVGVKWLDGTYPAGFLLFHLLLAVGAMLFLPLIDYLDSVASHALNNAWPVLMADEQTYQTLHYQLTTLPVRPTLAASALGLLIQLLVLVVQPSFVFVQLKLLTSPFATVVDVLLSCPTWAGAAVVAYHTIHQLSLVNEIYQHHTHISLFALGPLYAFSWLTARTALLIIGLTAIVWIAAPGSTERPERIFLAAGALLLAAVTFVAPLWSAHQLLAQEKAAHQDGLARRLEAATNALKKAVDHGELTNIGDLKTTIDALVVARKELDEISTWPWQPETLRAVVTALVAPLLLWLITRLVERFGLF